MQPLADVLADPGVIAGTLAIPSQHWFGIDGQQPILLIGVNPLPPASRRYESARVKYSDCRGRKAGRRDERNRLGNRVTPRRGMPAIRALAERSPNPSAELLHLSVSFANRKPAIGQRFRSSRHTRRLWSSGSASIKPQVLTVRSVRINRRAVLHPRSKPRRPAMTDESLPESPSLPDPRRRGFRGAVVRG